MFYPVFTYHIINSVKKDFLREKALLSEDFGWIFVNSIPLLYEKKRVVKQSKIETWLDLSQVAMELGIDKSARAKPNMHATRDYIV